MNKKRTFKLFLSISTIFVLTKVFTSNYQYSSSSRVPSSSNNSFKVSNNSPENSGGKPNSKSSNKSKEKLKKKLLPLKPSVLYINEQRNLRRVVAADSMKSKPTFKGTQISSRGGEYKILDSFFAVPLTEENKLKYPDAQNKLNHLIVNSNNPDNVPSDALKVTQNQDNGAIGIMTGILKVKLKDFSLNHELFSHSEYSIQNSYDHISLVHFKFENTDLAISENIRLQSHPNVTRASLEILEFSRHSR